MMSAVWIITPNKAGILEDTDYRLPEQWYKCKGMACRTLYSDKGVLRLGKEPLSFATIRACARTIGTAAICNICRTSIAGWVANGGWSGCQHLDWKREHLFRCGCGYSVSDLSGAEIMPSDFTGTDKGHIACSYMNLYSLHPKHLLRQGLYRRTCSLMQRRAD